MKAIGLMRFGGPEVLHVVDLPEPEPHSGEVRIRVYAAAVNPTDRGPGCCPGAEPAPARHRLR